MAPAPCCRVRVARLALRCVAVAGVVALASAPVAGVAHADAAVERAVADFSEEGAGVYLDPAAHGEPLSPADALRVERTVHRAVTPVFVAALGETSGGLARAHLHELIDRLDRHGTYVVVGTGGFVVASDVRGVDGQTQALSREAIDAHPNKPAAQLAELVRLADAAASSAGGDSGQAHPVPIGGDGQDSTGSSGINWVPILLVVAAVVGGVALFRRSGRRGRQASAAAFADVRRAADEDVTLLGEELTALDVPPTSSPESNADYAAALNAYEQAKVALARARRPEDVRAVTAALEDGRWRLACVRARLAGQPVPERRPPCFFNPQHGPSVEDVSWSPSAGQPRDVPVCAADAGRLRRGEDPDARMVTGPGGRVPYWQGPAYYGPYAGGFFGGWGGGAFLGGLLVGELLTSPAAFADSGHDGGYDAGYDSGYGAGQDAGDGDFASDFDTGGGDFDGGSDWGGGGDFGGGGDWGGGDFGGGDF
jgi:hypothetical protein